MMRYLLAGLLLPLAVAAFDGVDALVEENSSVKKTSKRTVGQSATDMQEQLRHSAQRAVRETPQVAFNRMTREILHANQEIERMGPQVSQDLALEEKLENRISILDGENRRAAQDVFEQAHRLGMDATLVSRSVETFMQNPNARLSRLPFHELFWRRSANLFGKLDEIFQQLPISVLNDLGLAKNGKPLFSYNDWSGLSPGKVAAAIEKAHSINPPNDDSMKALRRLASLKSEIPSLRNYDNMIGRFFLELTDLVEREKLLAALRKQREQLNTKIFQDAEKINGLKNKISTAEYRLDLLDPNKLSPPNGSGDLALAKLRSTYFKKIKNAPRRSLPRRIMSWMSVRGLRVLKGLGGAASAGFAGVMIYDGLQARKGHRKEVDLGQQRVSRTLSSQVFGQASGQTSGQTSGQADSGH